MSHGCGSSHIGHTAGHTATIHARALKKMRRKSGFWWQKPSPLGLRPPLPPDLTDCPSPLPPPAEDAAAADVAALGIVLSALAPPPWLLLSSNSVPAATVAPGLAEVVGAVPEGGLWFERPPPRRLAGSADDQVLLALVADARGVRPVVPAGDAAAAAWPPSVGPAAPSLAIWPPVALARERRVRRMLLVVVSDACGLVLIELGRIRCIDRMYWPYLVALGSEQSGSAHFAFRALHREQSDELCSALPQQIYIIYVI